MKCPYSALVGIDNVKDKEDVSPHTPLVGSHWQNICSFHRQHKDCICTQLLNNRLDKAIMQMTINSTMVAPQVISILEEGIFWPAPSQ